MLLTGRRVQLAEELSELFALIMSGTSGTFSYFASAVSLQKLKIVFDVLLFTQTLTRCFRSRTSASDSGKAGGVHQKPQRRKVRRNQSPE